jgi:hypothetical protein
VASKSDLLGSAVVDRGRMARLMTSMAVVGGQAMAACWLWGSIDGGVLPQSEDSAGVVPDRPQTHFSTATCLIQATHCADLTELSPSCH